MPIYQFDTPKGVLEFDHDGDPSELTGAVDSFLKGQEAPAAAPVEQPKPSQTGRDLAARAYSGVAKAAADTIVGTSRLPGANPLLDLVKAVPGGKELVKSGQEYFQKLGESADAAYGVDEAQNETIPSKLISGLSSVVPAIASGPLRSITMAGMMGEQSLQDAERKDEQNRLEGKAPVTETQKNIAFGAGAAVGLISEALLGIPALIRSAKAAKIPTDKFMDLVKTVAWQGAKSAPREGIQEWAENTGQNIIANQIAGYDPERGTFEGSGEALLFGAAIGVPVGATVQAAASLDAIKAQSKATAEQVNTTIDEVAAAEPPPVVEQSEGLAPPAGLPSVSSRTKPVGSVDLNQQEEIIVQGRMEGAAKNTPKGLPEINIPDPFSPYGSISDLPPSTAAPGIVSTDEQFRQGSGTADTTATGQISPTGQQPTTPETETEVSPEAAPQEVQATSTGKFSAAQLKDRMASAESRWLSAPDQDTKNKIWDEMQEIDSQYKKATGESMGPGAASAEEFNKRLAFAIKNEDIDKLRVARGQQPLVSEASKAFEEVWSETERRIANDEAYGSKVVDEILEGKDSASDEEQAAIAHELVRLNSEMAMEQERAGDEFATQPEREAAARRATEIEKRLGETEQAARKVGTLAGRLLRFRQNLIRDDYTSEGIQRRMRAAKRGPLEPEEVAEFREFAKRIEAELDLEQKAQEKYDAEQSKKAAEDSLRQHEGRSGIDQRILEYAAKQIKKLEDEAAAASERWRKRHGVLRAVSPEPNLAQDIKDLATILVAKIARFGVNKSQALSELIEDLGPPVEPIFDKSWDEANKQIDKIGRGLPERKRKALQKKIKAGAGTDQERQGIIAGIKEMSKEEGFKQSDLDQHIKSLFKNFSDSGMRGLDKITKAVQGLMKQNGFDLTERQIHDAFSDYGKSEAATTDPAKVDRAQMRREAQLYSALEDTLEKIRNEKAPGPRATGKGRVGPSDLARRTQKLLNEAKKKLPKEKNEGTLRSALESRKTYYQNRLKDLRFEIGKKERIVRETTSPPTDTELEALKKEYEEVKRQHQEIFKKPDLTDQQRLDAAIKATARAEEAAKQRLEDARKGVFPARKPSGPTSPELEAARARVEQLRDEAEELRQLSDAFKQEAEQKKIEQVEQQIARLDTQLRTGKIEPEAKPTEEMSQERENLILKRDAMRQHLLELRRKAAEKTPDQKLKEDIAKAEKSLAELRAKVDAGDISRKPRPAGPTGELARIAKEREELNKELAKLRRAAMPKRTKEEISLQAYKARLKREEADLLGRHAKADKGDAAAFEKKKPVKLDISKSPEVVASRARVQAMKDELKKKEEAYIKANRTASQRLKDAAADLLQSARGIILGSDIGVLTRQGLFSWSRPVTAIKATSEAFKSAFSPASMARWEIEVRDRLVNGQPAEPIRKASGLRMSNRTTHPEELVISRLLSRIPDFKVGDKTIKLSEIGRTFERFQTTFINAVRADLFDAGIRQGMSPEELKRRANFINSSTGISNLEYVPKAMSLIFTSPRYEASRWEMLTQPVRNIGALARAGLSGELDKAALANLQDLIVAAAYFWGIFRMAETMAGYKVNWNPTSSDFLKMRKGNEVWDISAGLAPRIRDVMRIFVAITHPDSKHNITKQVGSIGSRAINPAIRVSIDQAGVAAQRFRGVENPKLPWSGIKSEEESEGWIALAPLIVQGINKSLEDGTGSTVWTGAREFIGGSVNRYPAPKDEPFPPRDK